MDELRKYREIFEKLNDEKKLMFIWGLMLRQRNLFLDFCERFGFEKKDACLDAFKDLYRCIMECKKCELETFIEDMNPECYEWDDEVQDLIGYISTIVDNMVVLCREINERESIDTYFTRCNYDLIMAYILDNTNIKYDDIEAIRNHPYMQLEIERGINELMGLAEGKCFSEEKLELREMLLQI